MSLLLAAAVVAAVDRGVIVARGGTAEMFDSRPAKVLWTTDSVTTPARIITSRDRVAVVDSLANEVTVIETATGRSRRVATGETPIDGLFVGSQLYLLERDARALERIAADGTKSAVAVAADPAFLRPMSGRIYVYSRLDGVVQEITLSPFAVRRTAHASPFASDFEVDERNAYLVHPRAGKIEVLSLSSMAPAGSIDVGAVPVDVAFLSRSTALTARNLAVADPSAKRVWIMEGSQSFTQALTRGFLRGLLGLGLFGSRNSEFPTGVDRVFVSGSHWYAYDTSSGTLYRVTKSKSSVVFKGVAPQEFSVAPSGVYVWDDAVRRLQRINADE